MYQPDPPTHLQHLQSCALKTRKNYVPAGFQARFLAPKGQRSGGLKDPERWLDTRLDLLGRSSVPVTDWEDVSGPTPPRWPC